MSPNKQDLCTTIRKIAVFLNENATKPRGKNG